ncbi:MAG: hypothetical protein NC925_04020, partial [Candidatus Omnitrophica bacterium]|nr:hypothetical protein [Candidatus Omnitrophota bacterium]
MNIVKVSGCLFVLFFFVYNLEAKKIWREPFSSYSLSCGKSGGRIFLPISSDPKSFNPIVAKENYTTT